MKMRVVLALVVAAVALPTCGRAQQMTNGQVSFRNTSDRAIWVTLYQFSGRDKNIARGCLPGGGGTLSLYTNAPQVANWRGYYMLAEIKEDRKSCSVHSNRKIIEPGTPMRSQHTLFYMANYQAGPDVAYKLDTP